MAKYFLLFVLPNTDDYMAVLAYQNTMEYADTYHSADQLIACK
jgi:hypothetical protein